MFTLVVASLALVPSNHPQVQSFSLASGESISLYQKHGVDTYKISGIGPAPVERRSDGVLRFAYKPFDPKKQSDGVPALLRSAPRDGIRVVQFVTTPLESFRAEITRLGGIIHKYVPGQAYLVEASEDVAHEISQLPFVRFVGDYHPAYRLDPAITRSLESSTLGEQRYSLLLFESGAAKKNLVSWRIRSAGGKINDDGPHGHVLEATLTAEQVLAAAHWDEVMYIGIWTPGEHDMNIARILSGTNDLETVAGFTGQGVRGQVRDGGVRQTHDSFDSRPLIVLSNDTLNMSHGTPTTGIVFGDGTGNASGRGILPSGQGIFRAGLATGATRYSHTSTLINSHQGVFESNSTGGERTLLYETESANMDDIIFDLDVLICQSQSNAGNQMSRPQAWAKNIVSVGGINHFNTATKTDDTWTGGSIGPASDGRIKPDLGHFYDNVLCPSSTSDTSYTSTFSGTSAATPITCGHFGLLYQMWSAGVFGNTVAGSSVFTSRCHAMTAKALMINSADQWPFVGAGANISRMKQGWGSAQVKDLFDRRDKMIVRDEVDVIQPFATMSRNVFVAPGEPALRITMCYRDPMGNPAIQIQHRINDLTLKVTAPNGDIYFGNNGLSAGNWSVIGGVSNTKDTVENVFVQNPQSGVWTVEISGDEIVEDAYVADGPINAAVSWVATGVTELLPASYAVITGSSVSGTFADMATSNNQRLDLRPGAVLTSAQAPVVLQADTISPLPALDELRVLVESRGSVTGLVQKVQALNHSTGLYEEVTALTLGTVDGASEAVIPNPAPYIGVAGVVRLRLTYKTSGPTLVFPWNASLDHVRITMRP